MAQAVSIIVQNHPDVSIQINNESTLDVQAQLVLDRKNFERAVQKFQIASNDIRFELLKRFRYGPKPSTKRRNKHAFRKDYLNPVTNRLSRSGIIQVDGGDRCSGKGKPDRHWW